MIINSENFAPLRKEMKTYGKRLVFTNGCFDILHRGHIEYLNEAKSFGDYLIVGLNSDSSVKGLKGEGRPVNNESDRALVLDNLKAVDFVILFNEETPYDLIKDVAPDILVKGGDWKEDAIVGSDVVKSYGGKVYSLKFVKDYSTTDLIKKIRTL